MNSLTWINIVATCFTCGGACVIGRELMAWHKTLKEWSTILDLRQCRLSHQVPDPFAPRPVYYYPELHRDPRKQVPFPTLFAMADQDDERRGPASRSARSLPKDAEWDRDLPPTHAHPCSFQGCQGMDVRQYCVGCVEFPDKHRVMATAWLCGAHTETYLMGIPEEARHDPANPWRFRELGEGESVEGGEDGVK